MYDPGQYCSARFVEKAKEPALYRVHDSPGEERLIGFRDFLGGAELAPVWRAGTISA